MTLMQSHILTDRRATNEKAGNFKLLCCTESLLPLIFAADEKGIGTLSILIFYLKHMDVLNCYMFSEIKLQLVITPK